MESNICGEEKDEKHLERVFVIEPNYDYEHIKDVVSNWKKSGGISDCKSSCEILNKRKEAINDLSEVFKKITLYELLESASSNGGWSSSEIERINEVKGYFMGWSDYSAIYREVKNANESLDLSPFYLGGKIKRNDINNIERFIELCRTAIHPWDMSAIFSTGGIHFAITDSVSYSPTFEHDPEISEFVKNYEPPFNPICGHINVSDDNYVGFVKDLLYPICQRYTFINPEEVSIAGLKPEDYFEVWKGN